MRQHVGIHILRGDYPPAENVCGHCGVWTYIMGSTLHKTRYIKKTNTHYYKVTSNCPYFVHHVKTPKALTQKISAQLIYSPAPCAMPLYGNITYPDMTKIFMLTVAEAFLKSYRLQLKSMMASWNVDIFVFSV